MPFYLVALGEKLRNPRTSARVRSRVRTAILRLLVGGYVTTRTVEHVFWSLAHRAQGNLALWIEDVAHRDHALLSSVLFLRKDIEALRHALTGALSEDGIGRALREEFQPLKTLSLRWCHNFDARMDEVLLEW